MSTKPTTSSTLSKPKTKSNKPNPKQTSKKPIKPQNIEYLERYLNQLSNLPSELNKYFTVIKTTDERTQQKLDEIDTKTADYLTKENLPISGAESVKFREDVTKMFNTARQLTEDKINFANQSYEVVDKYIRKLDDDLSMFESDLKAKALEEGIDLEKLIQDDHKKAEIGGLSAVASIFPHLIKGADPGLEDMPIDPNEPTYCVCKQVSYGHMIGCDNLDCAIEWFHFGCVGLSSKPKGKWYCNKCIQHFPESTEGKKLAEMEKNRRKSLRN
jgi:hypothetical protein